MGLRVVGGTVESFAAPLEWPVGGLLHSCALAWPVPLSTHGPRAVVLCVQRRRRYLSSKAMERGGKVTYIFQDSVP